MSYTFKVDSRPSVVVRSVLAVDTYTPYQIKAKLIERAIKLYQEFWHKMNWPIFHDH